MSALLSALAPVLARPELAAVLGGLGVLVVFVGLYLVLAPHVLDRRLGQFVRAYRGEATPGAAEARQSPPGLMAAFERRMMRRKASASARAMLWRAGLQITVSEYVSLRVVCGLGLAALGGILLFARLGTLALLVAIAFGLLGSYLPVLFVQFRARKRMAALETQLPDALDMVAASLQAGSGLGQAFDLISREMSPPVSEEFRQVMQEVALGLSTTEALTNLADRVASEDLDLVVTSINIQTRVGGNLVHVLRTITDTIRERIRIKGEIRVLTSQQRISAIIISVLPPGLAVLLFALNPRYMGHLLDPGITRVMLVMAVVMMIAGILSLRKITDIEV